jgi:hypothetical protein
VITQKKYRKLREQGKNNQQARREVSPRWGTIASMWWRTKFRCHRKQKSKAGWINIQPAFDLDISY